LRGRSSRDDHMGGYARFARPLPSSLHPLPLGGRFGVQVASSPVAGDGSTPCVVVVVVQAASGIPPASGGGSSLGCGCGVPPGFDRALLVARGGPPGWGCGMCYGPTVGFSYEGRQFVASSASRRGELRVGDSLALAVGNG
jgi:hypothetical protein